MGAAESRFMDGQRPLIEQLGLAVQPLVPVEARKAMQHSGSQGMGVAEARFTDGQRLRELADEGRPAIKPAHGEKA